MLRSRKTEGQGYDFFIAMEKPPVDSTVSPDSPKSESSLAL